MAHQNSRYRSAAGRAVIVTPLLLIGAFFLIYLAVKYGPPLTTSFKIRQAFGKIAQVSSHLGEQELRDELRRNMQYINVPFNVNDIAVTKVGKTLIMDVAYDVTIYHPIVGPHVLHMNPHVEVEIAGGISVP